MSGSPLIISGVLGARKDSGWNPRGTVYVSSAAFGVKLRALQLSFVSQWLVNLPQQGATRNG
jgi:hypothetical protein